MTFCIVLSHEGTKHCPVGSPPGQNFYNGNPSLVSQSAGGVCSTDLSSKVEHSNSMQVVSRQIICPVFNKMLLCGSKVAWIDRRHTWHLSQMKLYVLILLHQYLRRFLVICKCDCKNFPARLGNVTRILQLLQFLGIILKISWLATAFV